MSDVPRLTDGFEPSDVGAGNRTQVPVEEQCVLLTSEKQFLPSAPWVLQIELRLSNLAASNLASPQ